ncbi:hypothetical protein ACA910_000853 [Epithemia clementina (nom. ined.)]
MSCTNLKVDETPYNSNTEVLPRTGIMFEVRSKTRPVTIDTIEMDVRTGLGNPLNVEVYVTDSAIDQVYNDGKSWSLVTKTVLEESPSKDTAIVPAWHFTPVEIQPGKDKGFFIRMKGNYVDNTLSSNIKSGEQATNGQDLSVFAGYYIDQASPGFPTSIGTDVAPIFAGKFHYSVSESCTTSSPIINTELEFALIVDTKLDLNDFTKIETATFASIENLFSVDTELKGYVDNDSLKILPISDDGVKTFIRAYAGNCPQNWSNCEAVVTTVKLEHEEDRRGGDIKDRLYRYYKQISQEQLKVLAAETRASYVGLVDSRAEFRLLMDGVSEKLEMDNEQMAFLQDQLVGFLNSKLLMERAQVFKVTIAEQSLFDIDSIEVDGSITGGVISSDTNVDFSNRIKNVFEQYKSEFFTYLKYHLYIPGPMTKDKRYDYFINTSDLTITVQVDKLTKAPTPAPTGEDDYMEKGVSLGLDAASSIDKSVWVGVGIGGGILLFLTLIYCFFRGIQRKKKREAEKKERKEERVRLRAIMRGEDPDVAAKQAAAEEAKESGDGDGEGGKGLTRKNSSRRGLFGRADSTTNNSDKFVDEASSTSSEECNESSLLPSSKGRENVADEFLAQLGKRQESRRGGGFDDGMADDGMGNEPQNKSFDPFTGNVEIDRTPSSQVGPSSTGFDPIAGDERSFDEPDHESSRFSGFEPGCEEGGDVQERRRSTGNERKLTRRKSSKRMVKGASEFSMRDDFAETAAHASERAINKVRDLEMQALFDSSGLVDAFGGGSSFEKSFDKGAAISDLNDSNHSSGSSDKKTKKKKSKASKSLSDDDNGDDASSSQKHRKKLDKTPSERTEDSEFSDQVSATSSKKKKKKKKDKERRKSLLADTPEEPDETPPV